MKQLEILDSLIPHKRDINSIGFLSFINSCDIPFQVKRIFWLTNVPKLSQRGGHAHRSCQQMIYVLQGEIEYTITRREQFPTYKLSETDKKGVYLPILHWLDIRFLRPKTIVLVLCSEDYNENEYIRDKKVFESTIQQSTVVIS